MTETSLQSKLNDTLAKILDKIQEYVKKGSTPEALALSETYENLSSTRTDC